MFNRLRLAGAEAAATKDTCGVVSAPAETWLSEARAGLPAAYVVDLADAWSRPPIHGGLGDRDENRLNRPVPASRVGGCRLDLTAAPGLALEPDRSSAAGNALALTGLGFWAPALPLLGGLSGKGPCSCTHPSARGRQRAR